MKRDFRGNQGKIIGGNQKYFEKDINKNIILEGDGYGDSCIPEPCKNKEWFAEHICIYTNAVKYTFI